MIDEQKALKSDKGLDNKGVTKMIKTEGKYVEKAALKEQGQKKIDKIKTVKTAAEKTVNTSTDP